MRDPATGIVSAYMDFVILKNNREALHYAAELAARELAKVDDQSSGLDWFLELVAELFEVNPLLADRHWRPQVLNLGGGLFDYQLIGRMGRFSEGVETPRQAAGNARGRLPLTSANRSGSVLFSPTQIQRRK